MTPDVDAPGVGAQEPSVSLRRMGERPGGRLTSAFHPPNSAVHAANPGGPVSEREGTFAPDLYDLSDCSANVDTAASMRAS
jgi:hypothetical protein